MRTAVKTQVHSFWVGRAGGLLIALWLWVLLAPASARAQYREDQDSQTASPQDYSVDYEQRRDPVAADHYVINAELLPGTHQFKGKAQVIVRAREAVSSVQMELNQNLDPTSVTDGAGQVLASRRTGNGLQLEVTLRKPLAKDETSTIVVSYEGVLADAEHSPVDGVMLAYVGPEGSYLLYPARWFPVIGYATNRYTAEIHLTAPAGSQVIGGGRMDAPVAQGARAVYSISYDKPQFAGSIAVRSDAPQPVESSGVRVNVFFSPAHRALAQAYGEAAARMVGFFSSKFGPPPVADLSLVEVDDRSLGGYAGPQVVFLTPRAIGSEVNVRLLSQEVSQQWWRGLVSPATRADLWLDHGLATYSQVLYLEDVGGVAARDARIKEMAIDALTHDEVPIRAASRYDEFSQAYTTLLYDKAANVMHMLRWVVGDQNFFKGLRNFADQFAFQSATTEDLRKAMEKASGQKLDGFFLQWLDSTGASDFKVDYTIYRVPNGFKIAGNITQDQDLFSMPVEVEVQTDDKPVIERVQVTGKSSEFSINTEGHPKRIIVDPNDRVLKLNDSIRVRVDIARGEQDVADRDYTAALEEYQKALDINRTNSLAHYRVGEVFFALRNYQSAANAFRESLNGDLDPKWTEVWSHVYLGKIFDVTGQRERAVNEYQQAVRTKDDTQGALQQANQYLKQPYERVSQEAAGG